MVILIAMKTEPILEIRRENSENAGLCVPTAGLDSPLHSRDCKFARRYGKDYESEVHVNLNVRIRLINCIVHALNH